MFNPLLTPQHSASINLPMRVSFNGGITLKWMVYSGKSIYKWMNMEMFWGIPIPGVTFGRGLPWLPWLVGGLMIFSARSSAFLQ
jgi:hypothetical protein